MAVEVASTEGGPPLLYNLNEDLPVGEEMTEAALRAVLDRLAGRVGRVPPLGT